MRINQLLDLQFGRDGNAERHLGTGWSAGEDGFRWMVGAVSELTLPNPQAGTDCIVELEVHPFTHAPHIPSQRLGIVANGQEIGHRVLAFGGLFGWRIPHERLNAGCDLKLQLIHPDARRPSEFGWADDRALALSVRSCRLLRLHSQTQPPLASAGQVADLPASELVLRFESLGDNCEFGLVQRKCGQEPLGLLRFSNVELPSLIRGLRNSFAGLADVGALSLWAHEINKEFVIRDTGYGITYHTFVHADQSSADGLLAQQARRLNFLARKLLEDAASAEKIFVIKGNKPLAVEDVLPLYSTLCEKGDNTLLWVVPADNTKHRGSVEWLMPGLLRGVVERFAPSENAHDFLLDDWLQVCRSAYNMASASAG